MSSPFIFLTDDIEWSHSRVSCFEDCKYRFFLKYICEEEEEPRFYASYGKFMHKLIERYYKGELKKQDMKMAFLQDFSKEVEGPRPSDAIVAKYIEKGINYLDSFQDFPYEMVAVEEIIHFKIDGLKFVGIIDYLGKTDDGYIIIDNKSRELKPRSNRKTPTKKDEELDEMLQQLYLYAAAVKYKYGEFPKKLCFNCFKNGVFIEEDFDPVKYEETVNVIKKQIYAILSSNTEDFRPYIDYFGCKYICGFSEDCCYWTTESR